MTAILKRLSLALCLAGIGNVAQAGPVEYLMRKAQLEQSTTTNRGGHALYEGTSAARELWFDNRLDHEAGDGLTTYRQRYHLDSSLASGPDAPVLFYLCGEWSCNSSSITGGAIREHAKALHAHLVALEHRYYGKSIPFTKLTVEHLKYLSTENALKDAAHFQKAAIEKHGLKGPWIVIGASYSANLSAYYRANYPDLVVGSLASSAPVRAEDGFDEYDLHVAHVAGEECAAAMRRVTAKLDEAFDKDPAPFEALKKKFAAEGVKDARDFLYLVADVGAAAVQYGMRDQFCESLTSNEDELEGYASFAKWLYTAFGKNAVEMSMQSAVSEELDAQSSDPAMRSWLYQSCTEYGYWQVATPDPAVAVRSQRINLDYHNDLCRRLFGQTTPVDPERMNARFYRTLLDPSRTSHILFTNGNQDPWMKLSLYQGGRDSGVNPGLDLLLIDEAAHCDDLGTSTSGDSDALTNARKKFLELARQWIRKD